MTDYEKVIELVNFCIDKEEWHEFPNVYKSDLHFIRTVLESLHTENAVLGKENGLLKYQVKELLEQKRYYLQRIKDFERYCGEPK